MKSPKPRNKAQRKVDNKNYDAITMSRNYEEKLLQEIITGNYQLVYQSRGKSGDYRDSAVSKKNFEKK